MLHLALNECQLPGHLQQSLMRYMVRLSVLYKDELYKDESSFLKTS